MLVVTIAWAAGPVPLAGAATTAASFPPTSPASLSAMFNPDLGRLGLQIQRVELEQPPTYKIEAHGRRLAVYVHPSGVFTAADYLRNLGPVAATFLPTVFHRWSGLQSFDVCEDPPSSVDPSPEPPSVAQIVVTRAAAAQIDWRHITLPELVALQHPRRGPRRFSELDFGLYLDPQLLAQPAYRQALRSRP